MKSDDPMQPKPKNNRPPGSNDAPIVYIYTGPSMNPTLKTGDLLHVEPYKGAVIRSGDVIVFKPEAKTNAVTHRVVSTDGDCVRTRGDNNDETDHWVITRDHVLGRVIAATRGVRSRPVHGGKLGRMRGRMSRLKRVARTELFRLLQPIYHRVAAWGMFRWASRRMETRVVSFSRPGMPPELHLEMAGRVIGRLLPGQERWRIEPPFRLFINEDSLPGRQTGPPANQGGSSPVCE